jgi:hypothetical protein
MITPVSFAASYKNDPAKKGQLADRKRLFGDCSRYAVAPVYTRFDAVQWFVWDAESPWLDGDGKPSVIRQACSLEEAIKDL